MKRFIVAIDASINSSGVTIYDRERDFYHILAYSVPNKCVWEDKERQKVEKRQKENFKLKGDNYKVKFIIQRINHDNDFIRFYKIARKLFKIITKIVEKDNYDLYIEEVVYSYGRSDSISQFATLLKLNFYKFDGTLYNPVYNNTLKKVIIGDGKAKKEHVIKFISDNYKFHDDIKNKIADHNIRLDNGSFFEDMTDSLMLAIYAQKTSINS
jgi:Holliday junction resolvasome RuvABC endonuclease subunit